MEPPDGSYGIKVGVDEQPDAVLLDVTDTLADPPRTMRMILSAAEAKELAAALGQAVDGAEAS